MKTRDMNFDAEDDMPEGVDILVDWKATPQEVMIEIDRVLKAHGFEVEELTTGGDEYAFNILKIEGAASN